MSVRHHVRLGAPLNTVLVGAPNVVLALGRIWHSAATGRIATKEVAAAWALARTPIEHRLITAGGPASLSSHHEDNLAARAEETAAFIRLAQSEIILLLEASTRPFRGQDAQRPARANAASRRSSTLALSVLQRARLRPAPARAPSRQRSGHDGPSRSGPPTGAWGALRGGPPAPRKRGATSTGAVLSAPQGSMTNAPSSTVTSTAGIVLPPASRRHLADGHRPTAG